MTSELDAACLEVLERATSGKVTIFELGYLLPVLSKRQGGRTSGNLERRCSRPGCTRLIAAVYEFRDELFLWLAAHKRIQNGNRVTLPAIAMPLSEDIPAFVTTKGNTKADRDLAAARRALARQNVVVSRTSREKTAATAAYNAVAGPAKDATDRLTEAQKSLAESSLRMSEQFYNAYRSGSTDAKDWLDLMQTGAQDIAAFTAKIQQLRTGGLSETLIQQIVGMGATAGSEIAQQIALGGRGLVDQLNKANASLQSAADALGYKAASGTGRYALGGPVVGPGTGTSDSIWGRLSNGEWVVPAAAVPANRPALERMTYGRSVVERPRFAPAYAAGGYVNTSAVQAAMGGLAIYVQSPFTGEYFRAEMRAIATRQNTQANSARGRLLAGSH